MQTNPAVNPNPNPKPNPPENFYHLVTLSQEGVVLWYHTPSALGGSNPSCTMYVKTECPAGVVRFLLKSNRHAFRLIGAF